MQGKKRGLGKGLDSLLSSSTVSRNKQVSHDRNAEETQALVNDSKGALADLKVNQLQPGKYQPRRDMSNDALEELANSIKAQGILQPIVVRETGHQKYEIIAGERRWRAAKLVGLENVPCLIKNVEDNAAIAIALIENIQRENLNAMEEAIAFKRLLDEFELTHNEVAKAVGKSRTTISNLLRLNNLNDAVKLFIEQGDIEMGHARALLPLVNEKQLIIAKIVIEKQLSVRDTEKLVKNELADKPVIQAKVVDQKLIGIEEKLAERLGTKVSLSQTKNGKGKLVINFDKSDKLEEILALLES
ncbi:ParB/RepB/Spo0J family partition protein [Psychromonas sp. PT13]|uniref:ParB/RepB/Spo0J family partition protein n=1 Tax=Psychromonas sp. PT13 TaxID=3439547 RepID=UPI003EBB6D71